VPTWSGQGGSINNGTVDVQVAEWELSRTMRLADVTVTNSGHVVRSPVVEDGTYRFNVPYNSTQTLESVNFSPGDMLTGTFKLGNSGKTISAPLIVETLQYVLNAGNDVVRCVSSGNVNGPVVEPV
jgi:hypothetical protein